jgi:hypothetical protein
LLFSVVAAELQSTAIPSHANGTTGWELALVTAPSSNESAAAASKLVIFHNWFPVGN